MKTSFPFYPDYMKFFGLGKGGFRLLVQVLKLLNDGLKPVGYVYFN